MSSSCTIFALESMEDKFKPEFSSKIARLPLVGGSLLVEALPFIFFNLFVNTKRFFLRCSGVPHSQQPLSLTFFLPFPWDFVVSSSCLHLLKPFHHLSPC